MVVNTTLGPKARKVPRCAKSRWPQGGSECSRDFSAISVAKKKVKHRLRLSPEKHAGWHSTANRRFLFKAFGLLLASCPSPETQLPELKIRDVHTGCDFNCTCSCPAFSLLESPLSTSDTLQCSMDGFDLEERVKLNETVCRVR